MQNFKKVTISMENREELHNVLDLTGCEVSLNLPPLKRQESYSDRYGTLCVVSCETAQHCPAHTVFKMHRLPVGVKPIGLTSLVSLNKACAQS